MVRERAPHYAIDRGVVGELLGLDGEVAPNPGNVTRRSPRAPEEGGSRGSLVRLALADPLGSLLPLLDPFREPCQVGTSSYEKRGLERLTRPLVPVLAGVEAECDPGPFGQQVGAADRDLPKLRDRGLDV
jgi:hypothetical protein